MGHLGMPYENAGSSNIKVEKTIKEWYYTDSCEGTQHQEIRVLSITIHNILQTHQIMKE
jgi:hypothetical protein